MTGLIKTGDLVEFKLGQYIYSGRVISIKDKSCAVRVLTLTGNVWRPEDYEVALINCSLVSTEIYKLSS